LRVPVTTVCLIVSLAMQKDCNTKVEIKLVLPVRPCQPLKLHLVLPAALTGDLPAAIHV
jgi:hypothetical protein